ncbi:hypothetical protein R9C00_27465 [Flammeovirgaceae bacterium SG7u.111]|nr:hypothetical protein [Flammeovirgaceae bacterium SG7u.132]WPO35439.1 hypothetical protein R9C00_27465 [Flammeovirgaceae bacterium SG7u.111]
MNYTLSRKISQLVGFMLLSPILLFSQSSMAPLNSDYYYLIDRYEILQKDFSSSFFTNSKPYTRSSIAEFAQKVYHGKLNLSKVDKFNLQYLLNDNWEWLDSVDNQSKKPFLKKIYRNVSDFYHVDEPDFDLHISPVLAVSAGKDNGLENNTFTNTRGVEMRGMIGNKIGFYSAFTENQVRLPYYVQERVEENGAIPGEGFWKTYKEDGADYFGVKGSINFKLIEQISVQFGHDRNFIGNGFRSMFLSDFATNYLFLKLNTKVWKLNYTNIFARMTAEGNDGIGEPYARKNFVAHHLSINLSDNFNIGLFESVVYSRRDSLGNNHFEIDYLNPIIFFRALEHQLGDPDNVSMGFDFKWNMANHLQLYGQLFVDDIYLKEFWNGSGWFANKFGQQIGLKYINVANIQNLDLQLEYNSASPYTYSHKNTPKFTNYQHYDQHLTHPLGANFREFVGLLRVQPIPRLNIVGKGIYVFTGKDQANENWGSNIFLDYNTRQQDFGNKIGQGIKTNIYIAELGLSYQLKHNLFIDAKQLLRKYQSDDESLSYNTSFTEIGFRLNIAKKTFDF